MAGIGGISSFSLMGDDGSTFTGGTIDHLTVTGSPYCLSAVSISATTYYSGSTPLSVIFSSNFWYRAGTGGFYIDNNNTINPAGVTTSAPTIIAGGYGNTTVGKNLAIFGGLNNDVRGGEFNSSIHTNASSIAGGYYNLIGNSQAAKAGNNANNYDYNTIFGCYTVSAYTSSSFIVGSSYAVTNGDKSSIINSVSSTTNSSQQIILGVDNITPTRPTTTFVKNLTIVSGATADYVLTCKNSSGDAIWAPSTGGGASNIDGGTAASIVLVLGVDGGAAA